MRGCGAVTATPAAGRSGSVLLVEDDAELAGLLRSALHEVVTHVVCADTAHIAREQLQTRPWDLVVLDVQLPDGSGFDLCSDLRLRFRETSILMLTARASEADRVAGLELGADDYLTKPFSLRELVLRVGNLLRRQSAGTQAAKRTVCGDLDIDSELRRALRGGQEISLTPREFDLLAHLARHPDRVFTRSQLLNAIWGPRFEGFEHTVNSHINRLRAKLEADPRHPTRLVTVWGCGYRLVSSGH